MKMARNILILLACCVCCGNVAGQILFDKIANPSIAAIKSLQTTPDDDKLGYAVLPLLGGKKLSVSFDILEDDSRYLYYRIIHCDRNWRKSNLFVTDYAGISSELSIDNIESSFNTTVSYVHYSFSFPNSDIEILLSGNYVLQIYETDDEGNEVVLIQKRFVVTEQLVEIQASVSQPISPSFALERQQVSSRIIPHGFDLSTFDKDLHLVYRQNGRWDKTISGIQPNHISGDGTLVFNDSKNALFDGGAEFHQFEIKNLTNALYPVVRILRDDNYFAAELYPDKIQPSYIYKDNGDLNGKFLPAISQNFDAETAADYVTVLFTLPYHRNAWDTLNLYVCGGFNNWKMTEENRMTYNEALNQYEAAILLKQGFYGYTYIFASNDFKTIDGASIDGNFYQTENDYEIFVYFYDYKIGYDRCIGYKLVNSKNTYGN